mgnify:CR=1 FL=1
MPIKVQRDLPAKAILEEENIFIMDEDRAMSQDIRPLEILILNLMPLKEETETQLMRALSNTPLQVDCTFLMLSTHVSKNTSASHLNKFYVTFDDIKKKKFDGMIITGAPVGEPGVRGSELLAGAVHDDGVEQDTCDLHHTYMLGGPGGALLPLRYPQIPYGEETVRYL